MGMRTDTTQLRPDAFKEPRVVHVLAPQPATRHRCDSARAILHVAHRRVDRLAGKAAAADDLVPDERPPATATGRVENVDECGAKRHSAQQ
jgi:hypothetical protein